jgi:FimV-like protein
VEAAHSVFHSQDVEGETDGLLDTHRKKEESDDSVEMEDDIASMLEEDADTTIEQEVSAPAEEESIDPLADIADLGDMDLGNLSDEDNDDIFDSSDDVIGTKLDLAKAYIDMGDQDGARSILDEVAEEGDDDQRQQAEQLRQQIS